MVVFVKLHRSRVIGSEGPKEIIEALGVGHPLDDRLAVGHIPLSNAGGLVTRLPDQFREGNLLRGHAPALAPARVAPGQQGGAGRPADRLGVKGSEQRALPGQLVEPRGPVGLASVATEVGIALVIGENDHDIGLLRLGGDGSEKKEDQGDE